MAQQDPRVIVASPDVHRRKTLTDALANMGWSMVEAIGGADALNKLDSLAGIEAVLFDCCLPDLDVNDLDVAVRLRRPELDVMLVDMTSDEVCRSNRPLI